MKPKHLPPPFKWEDRTVVLKDKILFVPNYFFDYEQFTYPEWNAPELFGNDKDVYIEFCSGNGAWIAEKAAMHPDKNWVALEKRFDRTRKIWAKRANFELDNLCMICGEAQPATKHFIRDNSVSGIYINFPDPWPKDRHAKHRLVQGDFVKDMYRILKPGGFVTLVTDHDVYAEQMVSEMSAQTGFSSAIPVPFYTTDIENYGSSWFCDLWLEKQRTIRLMRFTKDA